ncbi:MAG: hypothetical protein OHK0053_06620 [Microscillaceae bacterium]
MNGAQIHLLLNHIPILGALFGLILLIFGFIRANRSLTQAALLTFIVAALVTIPVDWSGEAAEEILEEKYEAQVSHDLIHEHEEMAELSVALMLALGGLSLLAFYFSWRKHRFATLANGAVLVLALVVFVTMARTGHSGGLIRHPELLPVTPTAPASSQDDD